jgi:hypothetical protein
MKKNLQALVVLVSLIALSQTSRAQGNSNVAASGASPWPTRGWTSDSPASLGLDEKMLASFDAASFFLALVVRT